MAPEAPIGHLSHLMGRIVSSFAFAPLFSFLFVFPRGFIIPLLFSLGIFRPSKHALRGPRVAQRGGG
jgi:hypothetical protein